MTREERHREVFKNRVALGAILVELVIVIVLLILVVGRLSGDDEEQEDEPLVEVTAEDNLLPQKDPLQEKGNDQSGNDEVLWNPDIQGSLSDENKGGESGNTSQTDGDNTGIDPEVTDKPEEPEITGETEIVAGRSVKLTLSGTEPAAFVAVLKEAAVKAAMYDYDVAIELVKGYEGYETIEAAGNTIAEFEAQKAACVKWPENTEVSHLFVHSLIVDTSRAFGPKSSKPQGYNQYMTTISEFNKMMDSMYEKGYVLVSIHDIAKVETDENGNRKLVKQPIMLPEGKKPFVLSQDDVNYYEYMDNDGFADRIVIGEDGLPTCQYTDIDGTVMYGEYDMMPIIDRMVKERPDFSYRGAKGILAVTGYEGCLGYDTGLSMKIYDGLDEDEKMRRIEVERDKVREVVKALKEDGWEFASHSYTHSNMTNATLDKLKYDITRWHDEVQLLVGDTDIYIYPYGADICDWRGYKGDKYEMLKEAGFWYFCNVDAAQYWIQIRDDYMRMGRINIDGERMNVTPERLDYFFDTAEVYDTSRPPFK